MASTTVTRQSKVTTPKSRKIAGIAEGERVNMKVVDDNKIIIKKPYPEVWYDLTNFLPENFQKIIISLHSDSTQRFKRLDLTPKRHKKAEKHLTNSAGTP